MKLIFNKNKQELFIKTSFWNSIIEVFKLEKNIDISEYLVSIQVKGSTILVKTNNPLINAELLNFDDKIKQTFQEKTKNVETITRNFEVRYK
ncbi:MAG: hypothetical protein LBQ59_00015 [Candidatus Peribacteria bacterium]|jgi:hypothetical protein|nr:hypothetical protein [Candidatus Peribacteria bacterium]